GVEDSARTRLRQGHEVVSRSGERVSRAAQRRARSIAEIPEVARDRARRLIGEMNRQRCRASRCIRGEGRHGWDIYDHLGVAYDSVPDATDSTGTDSSNLGRSSVIATDPFAGGEL